MISITLPPIDDETIMRIVHNSRNVEGDAALPFGYAREIAAARDALWTTHTLMKLKMQDEAEGLFTADQMRTFALAWIVAERQKTRPLVEQCRAALAEELSAWDIDPPLHHVKTAHDACDEWLSAHNA